MPIPAAFKDAMHRREFWIDYLLDKGVEWPEFGRRCRVEAPLGGGYEMVVELSNVLDQTDLYLRRPGSKKLYWMGRNDLASWPRDVLRWEETLLINEAAARMDADFAASDVLLVLLCPFTPLTVDDDRKQVYARMRKAFASLGVLSTSVINRCVRHCLSDLASDSAHFAWRPYPKHGWVLKQSATKHYEWPRSPDGIFPFKPFAGLIETAKLTCQRRARREAKRCRPAALLPPRPKPKPIGLPDGIFTRAMLQSARIVFARETPTGKRNPAELAFKASVAAALAAMDAVPKAKAVVISDGNVTEVLKRTPGKRKQRIA